MLFNKARNALSWLVLGPIALALQGCGGGGGGNDNRSNGSLSLSTTSLTYVANGPNAATPAVQRIVGTVTGVTSGTLYLTIVGTGSAIGNITPVAIISPTQGEAWVGVPAPGALGVGTHTGTVTVRACLNDPNCNSGSLQGSPATVSVTYHVAAIQPSATVLSYSIGNSVAPSDLSRTLTIGTVPAQNWTATTAASWLTVSASGSSGGTLNASLVQNAIDAMSNGTYEASVTLQHSTVPGLSVTIPVSLTIQRTEVSYVSPYVTYTGTASDVIIRGDQLSQASITGVSFGSTPAQSFTVVNGSEIRATAPASLPAGRHRVQLQSNLANIRQLAELVVVDAPSFAAAALQYPAASSRTISELRYDAERAALGVSVHRDNGETEALRFVWSNNAWQPPSAISIMNTFGLALSADGREWIVGDYRGVMHVDADDFTTGARVESPLFGSGTQLIAEMAVANDGKIAMFGDVYYNCGATLLLYDPRKRAFTTTPTYPGCRGNIGASGDGSRLLMTIDTDFVHSDDVLSLDTATGALTPSGLHLNTSVSPQLNRTGSRVLLNRTRVYDDTGALLGNVPGTTDAAILSPDGTRVFAFEEPNQLIVYDLTVTLPSSSDVYAVVGAPITLPQSPGVRQPLFNDAPVQMAVTPDGRSVFIAGTDYLLVQPVP